jgi:peptidoglycan/xylan/chitin deacetylase (PgdA/CDA1 family)
MGMNARGAAAGHGPALRVLTYHRVAEPAETPDLDPMLVSATPSVFRKQMAHVRKRYQPVTLAQVTEAFLGGSPLPPRAVHVTVDDAYRDFAENAWPTLREMDIPVTVFVPTAYPAEPSRALWWDRLHRVSVRGSGEAWRRAARSAIEAHHLTSQCQSDHDPDFRAWLRTLPHDGAARFVEATCHDAGLDDVNETSSSPAVLSWQEIRALSGQGVGFGAHTRHHTALSGFDEPRLRGEIRGSIEDLTRELGKGPWPIAYPYGIYDRTVMRIAAEEGCTLGFTCDDGLGRPGRTDPLRLPRTNITLRTSPAIFALRMLTWFAEVDRWRHRRERGRSTR